MHGILERQHPGRQSLYPFDQGSAVRSSVDPR